MRTFRPIATLAVAALVVAACGGTNELAAPAAADEPTPADAPGEAKTLEGYLGSAAVFARRGTGAAGSRGSGFDDAQLAEEQRLIQQHIQACMQAQGFTYVPEEATGGIQAFLAAQNQGDSPQEYAETQGFGITTRFDAILEGEVDLAGDEESPNDAHLATLSEGEADAWQLALNGAPPVRNDQGQLVDPETGEVLQGGPGRIRGGCTAEAQEAVRGDFSALAELADDFAALDDRIAADPRIAQIRRDWAACMRTAGFDYDDEAEARQDLNSRMRPFLLSLFDRGDAGTQRPGAGGGNPLQQLASVELTAEQDAELQALQDLERSIAVASLECTGDTATEVAEITARYEAEFVEANRELLESIGS